jgi:hypothetical protein
MRLCKLGNICGFTPQILRRAYHDWRVIEVFHSLEERTRTRERCTVDCLLKVGANLNLVSQPHGATILHSLAYAAMYEALGLCTNFHLPF